MIARAATEEIIKATEHTCSTDWQLWPYLAITILGILKKMHAFFAAEGYHLNQDISLKARVELAKKFT